VEGTSEVGGGAFPEAALPTWLVRITSSPGADALAERLRLGEPPVVARITAGHVVLDPRTIFPEQILATAAAFRAALDV
jgi:L-seryl-tRNA(Ser) seleniumtransferase